MCVWLALAALLGLPGLSLAQATRVLPQDPDYTGPAMQQRAQQWQHEWETRELLLQEQERQQERQDRDQLWTPMPRDGDEQDGDE